MKVHIGMKVRRKSEKISGDHALEKNHRVMEGVIVYIHPRGRYHMVEYDLPLGRKLRECFAGVLA